MILTVVGCADKLEPPTATQNVWYSVRSGESLTVHCNYSSDTVYHLQCDNNRWTGDVINCTDVSFNPGLCTLDASALAVTE